VGAQAFCKDRIVLRIILDFSHRGSSSRFDVPAETAHASREQRDLLQLS
jgi:hypothetical protein